MKPKSLGSLLFATTNMEAHIYRAYKTKEIVHVSGRVVFTSSRIKEPSNQESALRRLHRTLAFGQVRPSIHSWTAIKEGETVHELMTDGSGYFSFERKLNQTEFGSLNKLEIWGKPTNQDVETRIGETALVDLRDKHTILISDLDGTVIDNKPYNQIRLFFNTMVSNSERMASYKNTAFFFNNLKRNGIAVFYVSSSPDQLYPRLRRFLKSNDMPKGPLYLKPLKSHDIKGRIAELKNNTDSKKEQIVEIMKSFPEQQFILLGDDANDDIEVFEALEKEHPHQLKFIGIHKISSKQSPSLKGKQVPFISYDDLSLKCMDLGILS